MPQIPTLEQRVQVQNLPSVRFQAFDTGADAVGKGLINLAGATLQIAQRERERADAVQLLEADSAMAKLEDDLFHNPDTGAYAKRGKDAMSSPDTLWPEWDKRSGEIMNSLPKHLHGQFGVFANNRRRDLSRSLSRHITGEADKYYAEQAEAYVNSSINAASSNYTDPGRINTEVGRALAGLERAGVFVGKSHEWVTGEKLKIESRIRAGALDRMMTDDPLSAQAYYDEYKDSFTGETQRNIEKLLKPLVTRERVREEAKKYSGMDYLDALKSARDIADPDLQAGVLKEIEFSEKIRAEQERRSDEQFSEAISSAIEKADPSTPISDILSPSQLAWAEENGKVAAIENRLAQRVEGLQPKNDPVLMERLDGLITRTIGGDAAAAAELRKDDPMGWYDQMDRTMWLHFSARRLDALTAGVDEEAQKRVATYTSEKDDLQAYAWGPLGLAGEKNKETVAKIKSDFTIRFNDEIGAAQEQLGRPVNSRERQTIIKDLMLSYVKKNSWWTSDEEIRGYEVTIPEKDRKVIIEDYRRASGGAMPTEEMIRAKWLGLMGFKLNAAGD